MLAEIAAYFREAARRRYETEREPPFTLYFHPDDALPFFNYAIPDDGAGDSLGGALARLGARFRARGRTPRFEIVDGLSPALDAELDAAGFVREGEAILMTAPTSDVPELPAPEPFVVGELGAGSPLAEVAAALRVARVAFGDERMPREDEAAWELERLGDGAILLGRIGTEPVSAATLLPGAAGWSEVAGVATLPAYRRRGLGAAVVAEALRAAARRGIPRVVLSAGSEEAGRVYGSVGFRKVGTMSFRSRAAE